MAVPRTFPLPGSGLDGASLSPEAELVLLARLLFREGYDDHLAGHISYLQPDSTLLVNPFELTWDEVRVADVMRIDLDGNVIAGRWSVNPAIELHLALHRARKDVAVAIHNHPRWGTTWAGARRVPDIYDQTSAQMASPVVLVDEYGGSVNQRPNAERVVDDLGDANAALLAGHGVFVMGTSIRQAYLRALTLEWRCRQAWHVEAIGGKEPLDPAVARAYGEGMEQHCFPGMFEAMARRELRRQPDLLT
jgi:ribulose-5-phosphate 4-epimerase/fuculose-1-phosphate aldolase